MEELPVNPTDENSTYLGDGAYVTVAPDETWFIWADRESGRHWVAVEPRDQGTFLRLYAERVARG